MILWFVTMLLYSKTTIGLICRYLLPIAIQVCSKNLETSMSPLGKKQLIKGFIMVWLHQDQTSQTKSSQTEPDQIMAGSIWLPAPEVCRKLEGSDPDCARQHQNFPLFTKKDGIWCCLASLFQVSCKLLVQEAR